MFTCFLPPFTPRLYIHLAMFIHETIYTICKPNQNGVTLKKKMLNFGFRIYTCLTRARAYGM